MLKRPYFFEDEGEAPLLGRNLGFVTKDNASDIVKRAEAWKDLLPARTLPADEDLPDFKECVSEEFLRIFQRDAERTYVPKDENDPSKERTKERQDQHIETLRTIVAETKDYHQGLGYISAFLGMFLESREVARIVLALHRSRDYCQGYFAGEPAAFVGDSRVLFRLLQEQNSVLHNHLLSKGVVPEIFATKWFVGLCLHVLPFEALFRFYELFLTHGTRFTFQFGLAYFQALESELMACKDTAGIMTLLRAEHPKADWKLPDYLADKTDLLKDIVEKAVTIDIKEDLESMREQELQKAVEAMERAKARAQELAEEYSDDEIVFSDED